MKSRFSLSLSFASFRPALDLKTLAIFFDDFFRISLDLNVSFVLTTSFIIEKCWAQMFVEINIDFQLAPMRSKRRELCLMHIWMLGILKIVVIWMARSRFCNHLELSCWTYLKFGILSCSTLTKNFILFIHPNKCVGYKCQ